VLLGVNRRAKYGKKYFVRWDETHGGRWYESDLEGESNGKYSFTAHDGDGAGKLRTAVEIVKLGEQSNEGDRVLAYFPSKSRYAMPGIHKRTQKDHRGYFIIQVKFDNGVEKWVLASLVHKLVTLEKIMQGTNLVEINFRILL